MSTPLPDSKLKYPPLGSKARTWNILVVDDEEDIKCAITEILQDEKSYRVDSASDPTEAYKLAKNKAYDLLITDFNMPVINGDSLYHCMKRESTASGRSKPPKLLLMSGMIQEEVLKTRVQALGGSSFLTKPFTTEKLLTEVGRILTS